MPIDSPLVHCFYHFTVTLQQRLIFATFIWFQRSICFQDVVKVMISAFRDANSHMKCPYKLYIYFFFMKILMFFLY